MKQFNASKLKVENETALALALERQQHSRIKQYAVYIGLNVHMDPIAVSIAWAGGSQPCYCGDVISFCNEAGPSGYGN